MNHKQYPLYKSRHGLVGLWLVAFVAYHMAWTAHKSMAFVLNGFDLAAQIRIHPAMVAESPSMRTSIFLWLAVLTIAFGVCLGSCLYEGWRSRWWLRLMAIGITLRVNPPQGAVRSGLLQNDYAMTLTALTILGLGLVMLVILLEKNLLKHFRSIMFLNCLVGILFPMLGLSRALGLLQELQLESTLGGGAVLYVLALLTIGVVDLWGWKVADDPSPKAEAVLSSP
jgi:hypothetical protein